VTEADMGADAKPSTPAQAPFAEPTQSRSRSDIQLPKETESSLPKALRTIVGIIPLGILLGLLGFGIWLAIGFALGKLYPARSVTVQQFEISSEIANRGSVSGKTASDIVVDTLNDTASRALAYHGTDYYNWGSTGSQPVALRQSITVPLQASYGIQISGVSLDSLIQLYDRQRYHQWTIGGDIISSPKGLVGRIRLNQGDRAQSWETGASTSASPADLVREATYMMLTSIYPEQLGRFYLQQNSFEAAAKFFREWAMTNPQDWKPSYYLSLVYDNKHDEQDAYNLANWSKEIENLNRNKISEAAVTKVDSRSTPAAELANITHLALKTGKPLDISHASLSEKMQALSGLQEVEREAKAFSQSDPEEVNYLIQVARILDQEALIESSLDASSAQAAAKSEEAIRKLNEAIQKVPGNAGLYEQRAVLFMDLVSIMRSRKSQPAETQAKEEKELEDYIRALKMQPQQPGPMWGAVYAALDLHRGQDAVDLARTITLLQPDSNVAAVAYTIAVEENKEDRQGTETEEELKDRLIAVFQTKPDDSQMRALFYAFQKNNSPTGMDLVAAEGRQRFPTDATFRR
jgi:tetratricopeptide (TPR) repeat protein